MGKRLYLLKIGGSLIAGQKNPNEIHKREIKRILTEIDAARRLVGFDLIIGHGSAAPGHVPSQKYGVSAGFTDERARYGSVLTERACSRLNDVVVQTALDIGMPVFSFSPHSFSTTISSVISNIYIEPVEIALRNGMAPIIYGDVLMDYVQGFSDISTEKLLAAFARRLHPEKVIFCTDVDGVFDSNPKLEKSAKFIHAVNRRTIKEVISRAGPSLKIDVTGGMKTKVSLLYDAVKGTTAKGYILNGTVRGAIYRFLTGKRTKHTVVMW
ncbi:MAG: isopentenyl phosphate kinase [Candidatus Marsarchaeota archaeon]|nr:isopentenyl phosphate kinase [Candidatus Marsarchaeota archaeon]